MFTKKTPYITLLLALTLGTSVQAQVPEASTQLQIYGAVDIGIASSRINHTNRTTGLFNGSLENSFWGLKGTEDLGSGLQAFFQLESGFDTSTGAHEDESSFFNYAAKLGLQHEAYGTLSLGRQNPVSQEFNAELDLAAWADYGMGALLRNSDDYQVNNSFQYQSPQWNGWQVGVGYKAKDDHYRTDPEAQPATLNTALRYESGRFYAALSYDQQLSSHYGERKAHAWQLGMKYAFEPVTLSAAWSRQKNGFVGGNGNYLTPFAQGGRIDSGYVAAAVPLSEQGELIAQWSLAKPNWRWSNNEKAKKAQVYSLGYLHDISARTQLYTYGGYGKHTNPDQMISLDNPNSSRLAVGLIHYF